MKDLYALILAAGKGTRMVSNRAKVLHKVCGVPMLRMIYNAALGIEPDEIMIVIGQDADQVRAALGGLPARFVLQREQLGTGHAAMTARELLRGKKGDVLVLSGDAPRIRTATLRNLVERHRNCGAATTLLTAHSQQPFGYGRILRSGDGRIEAIVEERDATPEQRAVTEINPGFYCFQIGPLIESLDRLTDDNVQKEYYLTDIVRIQHSNGLRVEGLLHGDFEELRGINTRRELAELSLTVGKEKNQELMASGVTLIDPDRTYVDQDVVVEKDVTLYPVVTLEGKTRIGEGCIIRSGARIADSVIGPDVQILESCLITDSEVGAGTTIGPCARLRQHVVVGQRCRIGNFVEIKKSTLGDETKAAHLAYIGDAVVGSRVNISAGVVTCNFDGVRKNITIIEDEAFVGTNSQLVAPVRIGRGAYIAAGSCITRDVPAGALGIERTRQINKEGWVERRKRLKESS